MKKRLVIYLLSACVLSSFAAAADDAPAMFLGNPQHIGVYSGAGVPSFHQLKWKFHTQGRVISSPVISHETLYVGSTDHNFYALNLDGSLKWKFRTRSGITSTAAVSATAVYFGSYDGTFYALDPTTGAVKWKFETGGERRYAGTQLHGSQPAGEKMPDPFDFYLSSPTLAGGLVYFGGGDGNIYALDAASGRQVWKFQTGDVVHASPAIADGVVFIGSWDTYFYALDAATGKEKWRFKTGDDPKVHNQIGIQASAVVANGVVYFGCRDSNFYALDAATGEKRWSFSNHGSWVISSAAVRDGVVYFGTSDSGMFHALDAKSGAPIFSLKFIWPMFSSPAIAGDTLYIGSHNGKLLTVDLKSHQPGWTFETDGARENGATYTKPDGSPNYEAGFADNFYDDMVIGVRKMLSVGAILSSTVVDKSVIYFGSADGNLYALI